MYTQLCNSRENLPKYLWCLSLSYYPKPLFVCVHVWACVFYLSLIYFCAFLSSSPLFWCSPLPSPDSCWNPHSCNTADLCRKFSQAEYFLTLVFFPVFIFCNLQSPRTVKKTPDFSTSTSWGCYFEKLDQVTAKSNFFLGNKSVLICRWLLICERPKLHYLPTTKELLLLYFFQNPLNLNSLAKAEAGNFNKKWGEARHKLFPFLETFLQRPEVQESRKSIIQGFKV